MWKWKLTGAAQKPVTMSSVVYIQLLMDFSRCSAEISSPDTLPFSWQLYFLSVKMPPGIVSPLSWGHMDLSLRKSGGGKKWSDSGYILKAKSNRFCWWFDLMWGIRERIHLACMLQTPYKSHPPEQFHNLTYGHRLTEHCIINHLTTQSGATNSVSKSSWTLNMLKLLIWDSCLSHSRGIWLF